MNNLYIKNEIAIEPSRTGIKIIEYIRKIDNVSSKDSISFWGILEQLEKSCVSALLVCTGNHVFVSSSAIWFFLPFRSLTQVFHLILVGRDQSLKGMPGQYRSIR